MAMMHPPKIGQVAVSLLFIRTLQKKQANTLLSTPYLLKSEKITTVDLNLPNHFKRMTLKYFIKAYVVALLIIPQYLHAQDVKAYTPKVVTTERFTVEYMDFGGDGSIIINIQGAHNFFDNSTINETNTDWVDFCRSFSDKYHVLAPLNRGFGRTDDAPEQWNVGTQVDDLISFMDHLKIEKAFFFGKGPAAQNMLYLAENYPERILGIVFVQPIMVFTDVDDPVVAQYKHYDAQKGYLSSEFKKFKPSSKKEIFRPKMFADTSLKVSVPALYFYHEIFDNRTLWKGRIDRFIEKVDRNPNYNWSDYSRSDEVNSYFKALASDKQRMLYIQDYFLQNNPAPKMNQALRRAFGDNLVIFNESNDNSDTWWHLIENLYIPIMNGFFYINDIGE